MRCHGCGLVRTEPQPEDLGAFYPAERYYSFAPPRPPSRLRRARVRLAYGLPVEGSLLTRLLAGAVRSRLEPGLPPGPPGRLLDIGCGSGERLLVLREAGWECEGVEPSERAVAAARAAGLDGVRAGDLLEANYPDASFDAVRFWHSLEHVRSPRAELIEARRVLRPHGTLTVGVPNFASLLARAFRARWFYLDVPRHLWHFDRRSIVRLATETGFRVRRARFLSTGTPLLGTVDQLLGRGERLVESRRAWYAALPLAVLLDELRLGDGLELTATADPS